MDPVSQIDATLAPPIPEGASRGGNSPARTGHWHSSSADRRRGEAPGTPGSSARYRTIVTSRDVSEILWVDAQGVSGYAGVVDRPRSREQSFSVVVPPTATALRIALGGATAVEVPLSRTRSGGFEPVRVEP